mmetsp:Transcript_32605/g.79302  ORF Transcript_32605/g.79302 Transcript_32605/m.79302 type:complete len:82 (+) Transcript_32605:3-248(+)
MVITIVAVEVVGTDGAADAIVASRRSVGSTNVAVVLILLHPTTLQKHNAWGIDVDFSLRSSCPVSSQSAPRERIKSIVLSA